MKAIRCLAPALALAVMAVGVLAQDDPFQQLRTYDFQNRRSLEAIHKQIQEANGDRARLAAIETGLIGVLKDPAATFAGKQEACKALWVIGTARSVPVLAKMLTDEKLGNAARYALERNTDPAAGRALLAALAQAKGRALVGVINSLGDRGEAGAVGALKRLAVSKDPLVAEASVTALGKVGTESALAALQSLPKGAAVNRAMLRSAEKLAASGKKPAAERVYVQMAAGASPTLRAAAVRGLAAMQSPRAAAVAMTALKSGDPYVQRVAARVVGSLASPQVTRQAVAAWPGLPAPAQVVLLAAWADRREPTAAELALKATESEDAGVRQAAIRTSGRVGGAEVVQRLAWMAAKGPDADVAREALAGMPGREAEQALLQQAAQGPAEVRPALMAVLAERPNAAVLETLMESAQNSDTRLATEALRALNRVGGPEQHAALVRLMVATPNEGVRDAAKEAVVSIGQRAGDSDRAAAPLLEALPGASTAGKTALLQALAEMGGDRALAELTRAAGDPDPEVQRAAVTALADTWTDTRPLDTLLGVARSHPEKALRVQALRGYLRLIGQDERMPGEEKVAKLTEALVVAERPEEKKQALSVLRDARVPAAVELAAKMLDDADLFPEAADTVLYLAGPQKKGDRDQPAVKGPATTAALDKVIQLTKDDNQRAQAQKLR